MSEIIMSIDEFSRWDGEEGYKIQTNEQVITLAISNAQDCCEDWGYFLTEDNLRKFVGATLLGVEITDTNRTGREFYNGWNSEAFGPNNISLDAGDVMFVDIKTSRGTLQFVAYNSHNGYYGHTGRVFSKQLMHSESL